MLSTPNPTQCSTRKYIMYNVAMQYNSMTMRYTVDVEQKDLLPNLRNRLRAQIVANVHGQP